MATYKGTSGKDYHRHRGSESLHANGYGGNDIIHGNTNADYIYGGTADDFINGWGGDDNLYGDAGNDVLEGSDGDDRLWGSTSITFNNGTYSTTYNNGEYDALIGGTGYDTFVLGYGHGNFYRGTGHAIIKDYNSAEDYIELKGSASSFRLDKTRNLVGGAAYDTQIYSGNDLLAIVQDTTSLQLTKYYFKFG
ncbi:hypothetical protein [Microcoleus sp. Pol12B4]|uniref:hypothetical protein n=1 Tax=Microcoleus sp. Pol12B4 TaxID=3055395 RepID=UPI002FD21FF8